MLLLPLMIQVFLYYTLCSLHLYYAILYFWSVTLHDDVRTLICRDVCIYVLQSIGVYHMERKKEEKEKEGRNHDTLFPITIPLS